MLCFCCFVAGAADAIQLDLSLLRDEPASARAATSSSKDGAEEEAADETAEEVSANLSKCYDAERKPDEEEQGQEGFNLAPSDDMLDADLYHDIMHGVWDGNLSALLVGEVESPPVDERLTDEALEAFLAECLTHILHPCSQSCWTVRMVYDCSPYSFAFQCWTQCGDSTYLPQ